MLASKKGFSLVELLVTLAIVGIVAALTVPSLLRTSGENNDSIQAKQAITMVAKAWQTFALNNPTPETHALSEVIPSLNYVSIYTPNIDTYPGGGATIPCSGVWSCVKLHNGAVMAIENTYFNFSALSQGGVKAVAVYYDPDGTVNSSKKSVVFIIGVNGKVMPAWAGALDPAWFTW